MSAALAGPPLAIDDPGILEPGQWEIIVATAAEYRSSVDSYELPISDNSYGLTENTQLSFVVARQVLYPDEGGETQSDWGFGEVGYKWRFYNDNGVQLALSPVYSFALSDSSKRRGIIDDINVLNIPLVGSLEIADWTFGAQLAYAITSVSTNAWDYGISAAYPIIEPLQLLLEVYGAADDNFDNSVLNYHVGLDYAITPAAHVLFAIGSDINSDLPSEEKLDYNFYLGLQFFTE
ncbi:MAG: hypothetical protein ACR2P6_07000 [Gammaproteobacteria bacterium]